MRGQLRWVDTDHHGRHRPYLIVQAEILNDTAPTTIGLPVTLSPQQAGYPLTVELSSADTGLDRTAWVRTTQPTTIRTTQIGEPLAALPGNTLDLVLDALTTILDLDRHRQRSAPDIQTSASPRP